MGSLDVIKMNEAEINKDLNNNFSEKNILVLDIGTTNLKTCIYNEDLKPLHYCSSKVEILQPSEGYSEINPKCLLSTIKKDIKKCVENRPQSSIIKCLGISTQRNSIVFWNKITGETYCNIILWSDKRHKTTVDSMNKGIILNALTGGSKLVSMAGSAIVGHRMKAFASYKIENPHCAPKIAAQWTAIKSTINEKEYENVLYGTIETWLVWNLTKEKTHATDITCASVTGLYDFYHKNWSTILTTTLSLPKKLLPQVYDTCYKYGHLKYDALDLGYEIPITTVVGDANSSVVGECAFNKGDFVITMGTGTFISVNIGDKPLSSDNGFHSPVTFKHLDKEIFIFHNSVSSAGATIEWAKSINLFTDYDDYNNILKTTENSGGVTFLSAFDSKVGFAFVGLKANSTKAQMLRAVIDSIVYSIKIKFDLLLKDLKNYKIRLRSIRVGGGVAQSDFICQYLANVLNHPIERSETCSASSLLGAAFLAGLGAKTWKSIEDLEKYRTNVKLFVPSAFDEMINNGYNKKDIIHWKASLEKFVDML